MSRKIKPILTVRKNSGGSDFRRPRLNFIEDSTTVLTISDAPATNEIDILIAVAASVVDKKVKVSTNDSTPGFLEDKIVVADGGNSSNILEKTTLNDGSDEDVRIQIDESKITHQNIIAGTGNDHSYIDQDVTTGATPTFVDLILSNFSNGTETIDEILDDTLHHDVLDAVAVTDEGGINISWTTGEVWDYVNKVIVETNLQASISCTDDNINYLYWDRSGGGTALTLSITPPDDSDQDVLIATINCADGDIWEINIKPIYSQEVPAIITALGEIFPSIVTEGLIISEHAGDNAFDVDMTSGVYYVAAYGREAVSSQDSTTDQLTTWYKSGASSWTATAGQTQIDTTQWNNGTSLTGVTAARYYRSLFFVTSQGINWVYPIGQFVTVNQAINGTDAPLPAGLTDHPKSTVVIIKGNDASLPTADGDRWIDVRPILGQGLTGSISSHLNLTDIGSNTHDQVDTHIADSTLHYLESAIDHTNIIAGDGSDHSDVADNTAHSGGDGSDHADVATNTTHRGLTNNPHSTDYSDVSGADASTNVTGAELEELTDGSTTTLHAHAGGGGNEFEDNVFRIIDNSDNTAKAAFSCDSIDTGTTVTVIVPNESGREIGSAFEIRGRTIETGSPLGNQALVWNSISSEVEWTDVAIGVGGIGTVSAIAIWQNSISTNLTRGPTTLNPSTGDFFQCGDINAVDGSQEIKYNIFRPNGGSATVSAPGNVILAPDGSNYVQLDNSKWPIAVAASAGYFLRSDGGSPEQLSWVAGTGAAGIPVVARKTADESKTTDTSFADDTHLEFSVDANQDYTFRFVLFVDAGGTAPDIKIQLTKDAGGVDHIQYYIKRKNVTATVLKTALSSSQMLALNATAQAIEIEGSLECDGTSSTIHLQWAQNTSSAQFTAVLQGSYITSKQI